MAEKKISTTVYLTETQLNALKTLNQRTRVPIAEYIRMGIDMVLAKHEDHLPGQMSLFDLLEPEDRSYGVRPARGAGARKDMDSDLPKDKK